MQQKRIRNLFLSKSIAAWALLACDASTAPSSQPPILEAPDIETRQFQIVSGPSIARVTPPYQNAATPPDTAGLRFQVQVADSTAAVHGWVSSILVETDRGYRARIPLVPPSCLVRRAAAGSETIAFPMNFEWRECERIGVRTSVLLDASRVQTMLAALGGNARVVTTYALQTMPGAYYFVRVTPALDAADRARPKLQSFPEVSSVDALDALPACVYRDVEPRPPCPPWTLEGHRFYSFGAAGGDTIPVSHGGWVRATYTQADGTMRTAEYRF